MNLSVVFETWHLGDGNYPPLHKGELVNLSFEINAEEINAEEVTACDTPLPSYFKHLGEAQYEFSGEVLREYGALGEGDRVVVLECGGFRFYINGCATTACRSGQNVRGRGTLVLDHYLWVEFLDQYEDPPDLFYTLRVDRILLNEIPERYISRTPDGMSYPTYLPQTESESIEVDDIASAESRIGYYIVEFSDEGIEPGMWVERTFNG